MYGCNKFCDKGIFSIELSVKVRKELPFVNCKSHKKSMEPLGLNSSLYGDQDFFQDQIL